MSEMSKATELAMWRWIVFLMFYGALMSQACNINARLERIAVAVERSATK